MVGMLCLILALNECRFTLLPLDAVACWFLALRIAFHVFDDKNSTAINVIHECLGSDIYN